MTESMEIDCEVLQSDVQSVINSIVDKVDCTERTSTSLSVNTQCSESKGVDIHKENKFGIFSDLTEVHMSSSLECEEVHDHNSYHSNETAIMEEDTQLDHSDSIVITSGTKVDNSDSVVDNSDSMVDNSDSMVDNSDSMLGNSEQEILTVEEENTNDKPVSPQEDSTLSESVLSGMSVSSLSLSGDSISSVQVQAKTKSPCKDLSITPRTTRSSQNPDFAAKHRKFLSSKLMKRDVDSDSSELTSLNVKTCVSRDSTLQRKSQDNLKDSISETKVEKRKRDSVSSKVSESDIELDHDSSVKKRKNSKNENYQPSIIEGEVDSYCWRCHRDGNVIQCETCPRVYHLRCIQLESVPSRGWVCPECSTVMHAENIDSRSKAMRMLTLGQLCKLLQFAVNRMKAYEGSEEFAKPVDTQQFQHYRKFIVKPMDLSLLEENIKNNLYGSTEAFLADAKWILHNCVIFNTVQSKFTNIARALLKICRQEMLEIENCPDCYQNAHTRSSDSWFIEACRKPHILVWAKLKGFPFWPAKAMSTNSESQVDVRFFGAHDRAWVPVNACFLYSKMPPVQSVKKKNNLEECVQELEAHIKKLRDKFGTFEHAPYKTTYDPKKEDEQLMLLLPNYDPKQSPSKRIGRLLHERVRPQSAVSSPEKKSQMSNLKKDRSEIQKEKTDHKNSLEKHDLRQKRKAKFTWNPSRDPKVKCPDKTGSEELSGKTTGSELDELSFNNDDYDSLSPPKFFISKLGLQKNKKMLGSSNETKIAFVDKLQEKLSRLEKATAESEESNSQENNSEKSLEKETDSEGKSTITVENKVQDVDKYADITFVKSVVVLHDLKNIKDHGEKFKSATVELESSHDVDAGKNNTDGKGNDVEADVVNEKTSTSSDEEDVIQIDSSCSSVASNENRDEAMESNENEKRNEMYKKKNNINNVVETIKERKSSTDGKLSDRNVENDNANRIKYVAVELITANNGITKSDVDKSKTEELSNVPVSGTTSDLFTDENEVSSSRPDAEKVMLDSSEYPLVIIDEPAEDNMSSSSSVREVPIASTDTNKIVKSCLETSERPADKNRRKGKPAKVCSRESIDSEGSNQNSRRHSVDHDSFQKVVDAHIDNVLDEVSGKFTNSKTMMDSHIDSVLDDVSGRYTKNNEETNVTINVLSDESTLNKKSPKEIRASVNLSKDVSLSVVGDTVPSTLDMECISDSEEPVTMNENIPDVEQQIRPTARKTLPKPPNTRIVSEAKSIVKPPQQRKSVDYIEGLKIRSPQSLQKAMSPPLSTPNNDPKRLNTSVPLKLHNGLPNMNPSVQTMPIRNGQSARLLPPLHKPNQNIGPMVPGPLNAHLDRLSQKLSGRFRMMFEDLLKELSSEGWTEATVKGLQLEMERMQWRHRQEMAELKHNTDLIVMEVRASLESEKQRLLLEAKHKFEQEKELAVQETKRKQWCAYCRKEALLYCCWNTAYCSYPCQQNHWLQHMPVCAQNSHSPGNDNGKPTMRGNIGPGAFNTPAKAFTMQNPPQMHDVKSNNEFEDVGNHNQLEHDFDNNNSEDSVNDSLIKTKAPRRKRCGECEGCSKIENCQNCKACLNLRSHQVCQKRRCSNIMYNKTTNKKRHGMPHPNNMKLSGGFVQLNVPAINNGTRNMNPSHFSPGSQYMTMMHHQPPIGGFRHHHHPPPPPDMSTFPHQVFMN